MYCPNCGTACAENAIHCTGCGAPLSATCKNVSKNSADDGMAIAALICGICGFFVSGLFSVVAIVLGDMARKKAKENGLESSMADWGYWLGIAGCCLMLAMSMLALGIFAMLLIFYFISFAGIMGASFLPMLFL